MNECARVMERNGGSRNVCYVLPISIILLPAFTCEIDPMRLVIEAAFERIRNDLISNP